jgi:hypothetical protein
MIENNLYLNILPDAQQALLKKISEYEFIKKFYLAGGTALALQIGHRISVDFDFFCKHDIEIEELKKNIFNLGQIEIFQEKKNTLHCQINGIQISFITYKYNLLDELLNFENINLAGLKDIVCMKLSAISSRGCKKDFIDLYYLLNYMKLNKMLNLFKNKYGNLAVNEYQLKKSLLYFEDADREPMPVMNEKISWNTIKNKIIEIVKN